MAGLWALWRGGLGGGCLRQKEQEGFLKISACSARVKSGFGFGVAAPGAVV